MKSFKEFLVESISSKDIDKLIEELEYYRKNVRRIKNGRQLFDVYKSFMIFRYQMEDFVYKKLQVNSRVNKNPNWPDVMDSFVPIKDIYKYFGSFSYLGFNEYYMEQDYPNFQNRYVKGAWDKIYELFDKKRQTIYQSISKNISNFKKNLIKIRDDIGDELLNDPNYKHTFKHKGLDISVVYPEGGTFKQSEISNQIDNLKKMFDTVISKFKSKGIFDVMKRINYLYDLSASSGVRLDTLAHYQRFGDAYWMPKNRPLIRLFDRSQNVERGSHSISHEVGHDIYKRYIPEQLKKEWETFITDGQILITDTTKSNIERELLKMFDSGQIEEIYDKVTNEDSRFIVIMENLKKKFSANSDEQYLFDTVISDVLSTTDSFSLFGGFLHDVKDERFRRENLDKERKRIINDLELFFELLGTYNNRVLKKAITAYSNKNSEEAFCEAFAIYVLDRSGRGMNQHVKHFVNRMISII